MSKKQIEVFTKPEKASGGCCCSGNCCSTEYLSIDELTKRFNDRYADVGDFTIYELTTSNTNDFLSKLNKALADSGERLVINRMNMNFVLSKVLPLITVDGKVMSIKNYPNEEQLYHAIMTGKRIPTQPSCC